MDPTGLTDCPPDDYSVPQYMFGSHGGIIPVDIINSGQGGGWMGFSEGVEYMYQHYGWADEFYFGLAISPIVAASAYTGIVGVGMYGMSTATMTAIAFIFATAENPRMYVSLGNVTNHYPLNGNPSYPTMSTNSSYNFGFEGESPYPVFNGNPSLGVISQSVNAGFVSASANGTGQTTLYVQGIPSVGPGRPKLGANPEQLGQIPTNISNSINNIWHDIGYSVGGAISDMYHNMNNY